MSYLHNGYVADGYVESDEVFIPTAKMVSFSYSFILDGVDITKNVSDFTLNKELNRAYHTANLTLSNYILDSKYIRSETYRLDVTIANDSYSFIIYDVDKDYKNNQQIILKTNGCLLDEPFSFKEDKVYTQTNSKEILKSLTKKVKLFDTSPIFYFRDKSFQKKDMSDLDGLKTIVDVFGGEYFDNDDGLVISKPLIIDEDSKAKFIFNDEILTSKTISTNFDGSKKLHSIIINETKNSNSNQNGSKAQTTITMHHNGCSSTPYFTFIPSPSGIWNNEIHTNCNLGKPLPLRKQDMLYSTHLKDEDTITLEAGIDKITDIQIDKRKLSVSEYRFVKSYNIVRFTTPQLGLLELKYETKALHIEGKYTKNGEYNKLTKERYFYIKYKDKELKEFIKCKDDYSEDNTQDSSAKGSNCLIDTPSLIDSEKDTNIYARKESIKNLLFYNAKENITVQTIDTKEGIALMATSGFDNGFINDISVTTQTKTISKDFTVENLTPFLRERFSNKNFYVGVSTTIEESILFDTILKDAKKIKIDDKTYYYFPTSKDLVFKHTSRIIKGSFPIELYKITIPKSGFRNPIRGLKIEGCRDEYIEYKNLLNGYISCTIPQTLKVNVAKELKLSVFDIEGKEIDGYTIDSEGFIDVFIKFKREYKIDCKNIAPTGTFIVIDATNAIKKGT